MAYPCSALLFYFFPQPHVHFPALSFTCWLKERLCGAQHSSASTPRVRAQLMFPLFILNLETLHLTPSGIKLKSLMYELTPQMKLFSKFPASQKVLESYSISGMEMFSLKSPKQTQLLRFYVL